MDENRINCQATYAKLLRSKEKSLSAAAIKESFDYTFNIISRYLSYTRNSSTLHTPKKTRESLHKLRDALKATEAAIRLLNLPGELLIRRHGIKPSFNKQIDTALDTVNFAISDADTQANKIPNYELVVLIGCLRIHFRDLLLPYDKKPSKKLINDLFCLVGTTATSTKNTDQAKNTNKFNLFEYTIPNDIGRQYDESLKILDILDD